MHLLVLIFAIVFVISILIRFCLPFRYGSIQFSKFKVYRSRSTLFYLKWLVAYFLVKFGKRKPAPASPEHIERPQKQLDQPYSVDAVYFNTSTVDKHLVVFATAMRCNGLVNAFAMLRIPEFSEHILVLPQFPDTCLYQSDEQQQNRNIYCVEGIKLSPIVPMHSWHVQFEGKMKLEHHPTKIYDVKIDATWISNLPPFNYDIDISPYAISKAMALQPWSRKYFRILEEYHQTHFEQYGQLNGFATINGIEYPLKTSGLRDHTIGNRRDWRDFHRYVIHFFMLENGDGITVGIVSMPVTFSRLVIGFISSKLDKKNYAIIECDIDLGRLGEQSEPPADYAFSFWTSDRKVYNVEVQARHQPEFYIGEEAECRIVEQFCDFSVNGVRGWGAAEWQYRHVDGLPKTTKL